MTEALPCRYRDLCDTLSQEIAMTSFSQRKGLRPIKSVLQVDSMDDDLRNSLWNALDAFYWSNMGTAFLSSDENMHMLIRRLWIQHFKYPTDTINKYWLSIRERIREHFFACKWNEVYDFVEFVANNYPVNSTNEEFMKACNTFLEREVSAYRFVNGYIVQLTSEEEIAEIQEALKVAGPLAPVKVHLETALRHFASRNSPDYRNSIKESISAVEAICRIITGDPKATLGQAIKKLKDRHIEIHPSLEKAFGNLYGYTSDADGIRHALLEQPSLESEDAKFMLVSCSAFVNYLTAESTKAGIKL